MTTSTQQIPSNPALDFANAVLAETDNAREIIDMLHDIAQGLRQNSTTKDRINASRILLDRGLGKCPKQAPAATPNPTPTPETHNDVGAIRESPPAVPSSEPKSPRIVTQLDNALHDSLGPAPSTETPPTHSPLSTNHYPLPFDLYSIQQHILEITNNGRTLMSVLTEICRAPDEDPKVKDSHRVTAGRMLIDRIMGMKPTPFTNVVHPERSPSIVAKVEDLPSDEERWAKIDADLKRMEEAGILTPDPNATPIDISSYRMPKDFDITPYAKEEAAAFWAEIDLKIERQKKWPEIEEYRRKKLAQIYPSHSDEDGPPDT